MSTIDKIAKASEVAGQWWAARLDKKHENKKEEFAETVAKYCELQMRERLEAGGSPVCFLHVDYDPQDIMLLAVRAVIDPQCKGCMFSARGILPEKHELRVTPDKLIPKEGYGNWTEEIVLDE